ncbi:MAG: YheU family protein [Pseudomonadota bacterium]|jgi:uncharacterized protein YheU (UPF0270 family)
MIIPHEAVSLEVLRAVIEEFVSREGTDYGFEVDLDAKVNAVLEQLKKGKACLVFDSATESCDIVSVGSARYKELIARDDKDLS